MDINLDTLTHFRPIFSNSNRYVISYGGAGSGKSYSAAQKIVLRLLSEHPHKFLVIRKVACTLKESVFALIKSIIYKLKLTDEFIFNVSPLEIIFARNGNRIIFSGLDDPEKIKSITDITSVWIEEATELTKADIDQIDLRLRGEHKHYFQIIMTFNPIDENHWLRERFFNDNITDKLVHKSTFLNNPKRGSQYDEVLERFQKTNTSYWQVYGLGEWGTLEVGDIFVPSAYSEYDFIPEDVRSVLYCDPNLAIKSKGDTTGITEIGYSAKENKYFILNALCQSFADSEQLLNTILQMKYNSRHCVAIGFDGNVTQESTWTNLIRNWCKIHNQPFPRLDYKRYRVDNLAKNIQLTWSEKRIVFPLNFKEQINNKNYINQIFSFKGKKAGNPDDAPDSLICAFEFLHERKLARAKDNNFTQPVINTINF